MRGLSLAIEGLPEDCGRLEEGRVYWCACARASQADRLAAATLARAGALAEGVLVALAGGCGPVLDGLPADRGPARLRLYEGRPAPHPRALAALPGDLVRAVPAAGSLCIVRLPVAAFEALEERHLPRWWQRLADWARQRRQRVLLLSDGEGAALAPRLLPFHPWCAGLAQLSLRPGASPLQVHWWSSAAGVAAGRVYEVGERPGSGLVATAAVTAPPVEAEGGDHLLFLAEALALEGAPAFSTAWRLFEDWSSLGAAAMQATAATVVLALCGNGEVQDLARLLFYLRRERGPGLKLVVREMAPCLRYADERLLQEVGVSLIVPAGVPLARFLTLLDSLQGQVWQGRQPGDVETLIRRHQPPALRGLVPAPVFRDTALPVLAQAEVPVECALLVLRPLRGIRAGQAVQGLQVRRQGDFACVHHGQVWLFLFACRQDGIEKALAGLFRPDWRGIFDGCRRAGLHELRAMEAAPDAGEEVAVAPAAAPAGDAPDPVPGALFPRRIRLGGGP